jgi:hypothetical protein
MLKSSRPTGVGGVVHRAAEAELDRPGGEGVEDLACVRERAGEPVELGHHQGVTLPAGRERLAQTGALAVGARQPVIDVDALGADSKPRQGIALGGQVLLVGGHAGVADEQRRHQVLLAVGAGAPAPSRGSSRQQRGHR